MNVYPIKDPVFGSNAYLVDAEKPILIDTGLSIAEDILAKVTEVLGPRPLHAIVLTHSHPDHIGDAPELSNQLKAPLLIHPLEQDALPEALALGDSFNLGDATFQIMHTPGHSPGSVSLYDADRGWLFCGDCVFPGGRAGRWDLQGAQHAALLASVRMLASLEVQILYPGHYDPVIDNVHAHLDASVKTVELVGDPFDESAYDNRIGLLAQQF